MRFFLEVCSSTPFCHVPLKMSIRMSPCCVLLFRPLHSKSRSMQDKPKMVIDSFWLLLTLKVIPQDLIAATNWSRWSLVLFRSCKSLWITAQIKFRRSTSVILSIKWSSSIIISDVSNFTKGLLMQPFLFFGSLECCSIELYVLASLFFDTFHLLWGTTKIQVILNLIPHIYWQLPFIFVNCTVEASIVWVSLVKLHEQ